MQSFGRRSRRSGRRDQLVFRRVIQPFVEDANKLVTVANSQEGALTASIHNTGVVFDALTAREGQFRGLTSNGERAFHAFAAASQAFAEIWRVLPAFERNSQNGAAQHRRLC